MSPPKPHLVLAGVPVVQQTGWDEEEVVLVAARAVVPAAVAADLGLSPGQTHGLLAACGRAAQQSNCQHGFSIPAGTLRPHSLP